MLAFILRIWKWYLQVFDAEDELLPVEVEEVVEPVAEELDVEVELPEDVVEADEETELDETLEVEEAEDEDEEATPEIGNSML